MKIYNVHYPDGKCIKHALNDIDRRPELNSIFVMRLKFDITCYKVEEMNEEELWVEKISISEYLSLDAENRGRSYIAWQKDWNSLVKNY